MHGPAAAGKPNCQFILGGTPAAGTTLSTCVGVLGEGLRLAKQQVAAKVPASFPPSPPRTTLRELQLINTPYSERNMQPMAVDAPTPTRT